jgi:hypothetical protein
VTAGRAAIVDAPASGIATVGITASGSTVTGGAAACIPAVFAASPAAIVLCPHPAELLHVGVGQVALGSARSRRALGAGSIGARLRRPPVNRAAVPVAQGLAVAAAHDIAVVAGLIASIHG